MEAIAQEKHLQGIAVCVQESGWVTEDLVED
jgi:hypothetical protein